MAPFTGFLNKLKSPPALNAVGDKVELVERRLNGKILPFVGIHGTLLALFHLCNEARLEAGEIRNVPLWVSVLLGLSAATIGALWWFNHVNQRQGLAAGSIALATILSMTAGLLLPTGPSISLTLVIFGTLLAANARGWVSDYDANTVFIYLPLIFFAVVQLSIAQYLLITMALFGPAVFVKFRLQRDAGKMPLGFSILVFLSLVVDTGDASAQVGFLVLLALLLFLFYAYRNRNVIGSSYRHFLFDVVVVGLWGTLLATTTMSAEWALILWGLGVVGYESVSLEMLKKRDMTRDAEIATRDARLAWIQAGCFAIFYELLVETILHDSLGRQEYDFVGVLTIIAPFIFVYRKMESAFLALTTRAWIGVILLSAVDDIHDKFAYPNFYDMGSTAETLRADLLAGLPMDIVWVSFAILVGMAATLRVAPANHIAWWRGLIWPRHMVLLRQVGRVVMANASRIPIVGVLLNAVASMFRWMRFAGGARQGIGSRDAMLLGVHVFGVLVTVLIGRVLSHCCDADGETILRASLFEFVENDLNYVIAWCLWGFMLYLHGVLFKDYLARFLATGFVLVPWLMFVDNNMDSSSIFVAQTALLSGIVLFCFGLFRRLA